MPAMNMLARDPKWKTHFAHTFETEYSAIAQLYDVPWVSFRNAVWRVMEDPPPRCGARC